MDIISYSKAMKAKKTIATLDKRLGVGDNNKHGDKDIKDIQGNTKERLEELEKKRFGITTKQLILSGPEFSSGEKDQSSVENGRLKGQGSWEYEVDLGEDFLEFDKIEIKTVQFIPGEGNVPLVPILSSNNDTLGNVTSSSIWGSAWDGWKAFDNDNTTDWHMANGAVLPQWIGFIFNENKTIGKFTVTPRNINYSFTEVTLQGYNGSTWNDVQKYTTDPWVGEKTFTIDKPATYKGFRLFVTKSSDGSTTKYFAISALQFFGLEDKINHFENDFTGVTIQTDSGNGYKDLTDNKIPSSVFVQNPKIKVILDGTRELEQITFNYKVRPLLNRVSEVETNTNINLNKYNLRVSSVLNKKKYSLTEMVIDDFEDNSGIDMGKSINITHDSSNNKVIQTDISLQSEIVTVNEALDEQPSIFILSAVTKDNDTAKINVDLSNGEFIQTELLNGVLSLIKVDENYMKSGSWTSNVIDLGDNFKSLYTLDQLASEPEGTTLKIMTATSNDNINFEEFKEVNEDGSFQSSNGRYIKVKIELTAQEIGYKVSPSVSNMSLFYEVLKAQKPTFYVSRNDGIDWLEVNIDELTKLDNLPEGKDLRVKVVLENGEELYGISYSWI